MSCVIIRFSIKPEAYFKTHHMQYMNVYFTVIFVFTDLYKTNLVNSLNTTLIHVRNNTKIKKRKENNT